MTTIRDGERCPCRSGALLDDCCGPALDGTRPARTAEALMRSRYTAFTIGDAAHLLSTWHPDHRPSTLDPDPSITWRSLEIVDRAGGGLLDDHGEVEFVARFRTPDGPGRLHERSRFVRQEGQWLYVDGDLR
ncbi:YchJ family protein [Propionibacteriaceae bacterium Y1685]|uniref:YchJ family protein n=1 Tax=Microlunatus sp. Y1700 TaxID=3418487 RepID=UPI003B76E465